MFWTENITYNWGWHSQRIKDGYERHSSLTVPFWCCALGAGLHACTDMFALSPSCRVGSVFFRWKWKGAQDVFRVLVFQAPFEGSQSLEFRVMVCSTWAVQQDIWKEVVKPQKFFPDIWKEVLEPLGDWVLKRKEDKLVMDPAWQNLLWFSAKSPA